MYVHLAHGNGAHPEHSSMDDMQLLQAPLEKAGICGRGAATGGGNNPTRITTLSSSR